MGDLIKSLGEIIRQVIRWWFKWTWDLFKGVLERIVAALPDGWQKQIGDLDPYVEVVNAWAPLDYAVTVWISYMVFWGVCMQVKMVLKLGKR